LVGQATRVEHTVVVPDVRAQPAYAPSTDGRPGLDPRSMLLRSLVHDGQLLGVLQLIDSVHGAFTAGDVHVVNYAADRLSQFLREVRIRPAR
jgi:GAF domain-containing protein